MFDEVIAKRESGCEGDKCAHAVLRLHILEAFTEDAMKPDAVKNVIDDQEPGHEYDKECCCIDHWLSPKPRFYALFLRM